VRLCNLILLVSITSCVQAQWLNTRDSGIPRTKTGNPTYPHRRLTRPMANPIFRAYGSPKVRPSPKLMKVLPAGVNGLGEDPPPMSFFQCACGRQTGRIAATTGV